LDPESATCIVKLVVAAIVGVPEMLPVDGFNDAQAGSDPTGMLQVAGGMQLAVLGVCEYGAPTVPPGRVVVVIEHVAPVKFTVIPPPQS
jgi:hypothetical protein